METRSAERFVMVDSAKLTDLIYVARQAAAELREREVSSALADALVGSAAAVEQPVVLPV